MADLYNHLKEFFKQELREEGWSDNSKGTNFIQNLGVHTTFTGNPRNYFIEVDTHTVKLYAGNEPVLLRDGGYMITGDFIRKTWRGLSDQLILKDLIQDELRDEKV